MHSGAFILIWGLSWLFGSYWVHFTQQTKQLNSSTKPIGTVLSLFMEKRNDPLSFKSWLPLPCCPKVPLEPIFKLVLPGIGIFVEGFLAFKNFDGKLKLTFAPLKLIYFETFQEFSGMDRVQHISLYLAFAVSGVVDCISLCFRLPRVTDKIFLTFAFIVEYLLFAFHLHGRNTFNTDVHKLLMYFVMSCIVFSTLRLLTSRNLFINAGLAGSMILQGTHLCQAGWLLYGGTKWNPGSSNNIKFIASLTVWHLLAVGLFMVAVFIAMRAVLRWKGKLQSTDHSISTHASDPTESEKIELLQIDQDEYL